jgi:actin related protein 2/3 complex subunit 1A/1B
MNDPMEKQISYHAFSGDGKLAAVSKNDDAVYIYNTNGSPEASSWEQTQVVTEHGGRVSGIDWCAKSNLIVTCGHDRNAYVWKYEEKDKEKAWKPTLVILRINRAATCVRWSPKGDKFAVGSGAKCVPVCHFEQGQNWWISKMIKKHKSSVLDIAWSPNQKFLVTGSSDFKCRIFSAFIEGIDAADDDGKTSLFGKNDSKANVFGEILYEFDEAKAWVQGVAWASNGLQIAFAGHGSTLTFANLNKEGKPETQTIYQKTLPTTIVNFMDDNTLVAIGFDNNPTVFEKSGSQWVEKRQLDSCGGEKKAAPAATAAGTARNVFQDRDTRGKSGDVAGIKEEPPIKTIHQNLILDCKIRGAKKFSTSGVDGRVVQWSL